MQLLFAFIIRRFVIGYNKRKIERFMTRPPLNIDTIITSYSVRDDSAFGQAWTPISKTMWRDISTYDADGAQYGAHQLAPHLSRISKDGANFLKFLGYTEDVATNFEDAYRLSDIGKIDKRYDPQIWSLPHRPTEEERALKRKHTDWALDVIATYIRDDETLLLDHPHVQTIIPALALYHHERLDGNGPLGCDGKQMGTIMQVACIVDAYDGDRIQRPHQPERRTPEGALDRLEAVGEDSKYEGAFDKTLLQEYRRFKLSVE